MAKYENVGEGKYNVHEKKKRFGQVLGSFLAVGIFSLLSTQSADASPTQSLSEADPKIYAELSQAVTDYIESRPYYWYDDAKFTEVAYQVYDLGSLSQQYQGGETQALPPEAQKKISDLKKNVRRHAEKRYSLGVARTLFVQYPNGELSAGEALNQERALFKEKHGAQAADAEFQKKSLVLYYQREHQKIVGSSGNNSDWTFNGFASAEIKKAKNAGFAKVTEGKAAKLSTLLSEEKLRDFTKRKGNEVAAQDLLVKYYGHPPEVLGGYFSERLCDLLYEYIDKPGGITPASYSKLRTKILLEWNGAAGDLSKLKETGTAFNGSTETNSGTIVASNIPANPAPTQEPTAPTAIDEVLDPIDAAEDTANEMLDGAKKKLEKLEKVKFPTIKW